MVYINPDAFNNKDEFKELSEKVFATLSKGDRKLNYKTRTEISPIFNGKKKFSISLPEGYVINEDKKYDFEVLRFQKVRDIADTNWTSLTIYIGNHPSYFYNEYDFGDNDMIKTSSNFLNKRVEWWNFKNTEKRLYLREQKIPSNQIEEDLIVHIAMLGNNQESINELTKIIENIKLVE